MPDLDGIEVMRQLREARPVPVILLTAKGSTADKAKGLDLGADDYIAKPFHPDELAARVRAVIRRSSGERRRAPASSRFDDVEIDLERRMVTRNGELVQLSRTEWLLLQHLAANAGKVVLHTELLTKVWGPEYRDDLQYLRVWISRVRRKLGAKPGEPGRIKTFQGIGYLLDVEGRTTEACPPEPGHADCNARARFRLATCRPSARVQPQDQDSRSSSGACRYRPPDPGGDPMSKAKTARRSSSTVRQGHLDPVDAGARPAAPSRSRIQSRPPALIKRRCQPTSGILADLRRFGKAYGATGKAEEVAQALGSSHARPPEGIRRRERGVEAHAVLLTLRRKQQDSLRCPRRSPSNKETELRDAVRDMLRRRRPPPRSRGRPADFAGRSRRVRRRRQPG